MKQPNASLLMRATIAGTSLIGNMMAVPPAVAREMTPREPEPMTHSLRQPAIRGSVAVQDLKEVAQSLADVSSESEAIERLAAQIDKRFEGDAERLFNELEKLESLAPAHVSDIIDHALVDPNFAEHLRALASRAMNDGPGSEAWEQLDKHFASSPTRLADLRLPSWQNDVYGATTTTTFTTVTSAACMTTTTTTTTTDFNDE